MESTTSLNKGVGGILGCLICLYMGAVVIQVYLGVFKIIEKVENQWFLIWPVVTNDMALLFESVDRFKCVVTEFGRYSRKNSD